MHIQSSRLVMNAAAALVLALTPGCSDDTVAPPRDTRAPDRVGSDLGLSPDRGRPRDAGPARQLIILHTNDLHSSVEGFGPISEYSPDVGGNDQTLGGFARLAALVKSERGAAAGTPVLLLDAGDFMQGSLFGWLATTKYVELKLMEEMGYDAIGIGNHEFDWLPAGLAAVVNAAVKGGFKVPVMAPFNIKYDATAPDDDALEALQKAGALKTKVVKTLANGLKVGIFGLMGKQAALNAYQYGALPVTFGDPVPAAQTAVKELRETDRVDLVICLLHGDATPQNSKEDVELAASVPGLDVIVAGHTHDEFTTPKIAGKTVIVSAGHDSRYLGKLQLKLQAGSVSVGKGEMLAVNDSVTGDAAMRTAVAGYIADIDALLTAAGTGLSYKKVIAETSFDLTYPAFQETGLGDLTVDSYLGTARALQPTEPSDIAIESNGVIGNPFLKGKGGKLWFADVFHAVQAGIGFDQKPGYPLVTFHLTGADLKAGMEVLAAAKGLLGSDDYFLQVAGMKVEYLASGFPLNSVISIKVGTPPVEVGLNDTGKCYKVVTTLIVARQLAEVKQVSGGMLTITPREKDCKTVITDWTTRLVDRDPVTTGVQELKAWQAVVGAMAKFPDTNGNSIPDVPEIYKAPQGRIVAK